MDARSSVDLSACNSTTWRNPTARPRTDPTPRPPAGRSGENGENQDGENQDGENQDGDEEDGDDQDVAGDTATGAGTSALSPATGVALTY